MVLLFMLFLLNSHAQPVTFKNLAIAKVQSFASNENEILLRYLDRNSDPLEFKTCIINTKNGAVRHLSFNFSAQARALCLNKTLYIVDMPSFGEIQVYSLNKDGQISEIDIPPNFSQWAKNRYLHSASTITNQQLLITLMRRRPYGLEWGRLDLTDNSFTALGSYVSDDAPWLDVISYQGKTWFINGTDSQLLSFLNHPDDPQEILLNKKPRRNLAPVHKPPRYALYFIAIYPGQKSLQFLYKDQKKQIDKGNATMNIMELRSDGSQHFNQELILYEDLDRSYRVGIPGHQPLVRQF